MDEQARQVLRRWWGEVKLAVRARASDRLTPLSRAIADADPWPAVNEALVLLGKRERDLDAANHEAWTVLRPRVSVRRRPVVEAILEREPELARWALADLAEASGDGLLAASRLFDDPQGAHRLWFGDPRGLAVFEIGDGSILRYTPADVGRQLLERHGEGVVDVLRLVGHRPQAVSEVAHEVGPVGPAVLGDLSAWLVTREIGGHHRARGGAAQLVLQGLGRAA